MFNDPRQPFSESQVNVIAEGSRLEGDVKLEGFTRIHGSIRGSVESASGSRLVLCESGKIEGSLRGDHVIVDGYIRGDISASRVEITSLGRVMGDIRSERIDIAFGARFEGKCLTARPGGSSPSATPIATSNPSPEPA